MSEVLLKKIATQKGVFGHTVALNLLEALLKKESIPHALLFSGSPSIGKRLIARIFAHSLLTDSIADLPEQAQQSRLIFSGQHPDLHLIYLGSENKDISVEEVRELRNKLQLRPYYGICRIAIIDNAHKMSSAAGNALLKTLEEPSPKTYLILISEAAHRLSATIVSRCQTVHCADLSGKDSQSVLKKCLSETKFQESEIAELSTLSDTLIHFIGVENYVDPHSLSITEPGALESHCKEVLQLGTKIKKQLTSLLQGAGSSALPVSLGTELGLLKDSSALTWGIIRNVFREQLLLSSANNSSRFADLLLHSLQAEKLTLERNANAQLQLTSLLLKAHHALQEQPR